MKTHALKMALAIFLVIPNIAFSAPTQQEAPRTWWQKAKDFVLPDPNQVRFKDAFPTAFHQKSYFGVAVTGGSVVAAIAFSYATAGAGAPAAATGVSWVASLIGGGGAGSYMAGLSTVGGWFGGNAMLGSAVLNGISLGIGGASGSLARQSMMGKFAITTSVSATMMDGVSLIRAPRTEEVKFNINLLVPVKLGTERTEWMLSQFEDLQESRIEALKNWDHEALQTSTAALTEISEQINAEAASMLENGADVRDLVALAVLAHNQNRADIFDQLIEKAEPLSTPDSGYLQYLSALRNLRKNNLDAAIEKLKKSLLAEPYAIEPAILLINILALKDFEKNREEIRHIIEISDNNFDSDKYQTPFSQVSLYYRLGTLHLAFKEYNQALIAFETAYDRFGFIKKRILKTLNIATVRVGQASALYGMGQQDKADALFKQVYADAKSKDERWMLRAEYMGYVIRTEDLVEALALKETFVQMSLGLTNSHLERALPLHVKLAFVSTYIQVLFVSEFICIDPLKSCSRHN